MIPDFDVAPPVISGPDTQNILAPTDTQYSTANFIASLQELISNHSQKKVLPVSIRHTFFEAHNPLASSLVRLIFPDGSNSFLEDVVVGNSRKKRGSLKMRVDRPKAFYRSYRGQWHSGFLIVRILGCWRAVPDNPRGLEWMLFIGREDMVRGILGIVPHQYLMSLTGCFQLGATGGLRCTK